MSGDIAATIQRAREHSIGDLLRRSAKRYPGKTALICGEVSWSFAEMDAICNRLGRGLLGSEGVSPAMLTDPLVAFALGMFTLTRVEMYLRAKRLLDEARGRA